MEDASPLTFTDFLEKMKDPKAADLVLPPSERPSCRFTPLSKSLTVHLCSAVTLNCYPLHPPRSRLTSTFFLNCFPSPSSLLAPRYRSTFLAPLISSPH